MPRDLSIADRLDDCLALPKAVNVGSQTWFISVSDVMARGSSKLTIGLVLTGPHARFRRVKLTLERGRLLAGGYDGAKAGLLIERWLPYSDAADVLLLSDAALAKTADLASPADH